MLISATLSKPTALVEEKLGKSYEKIKIKIENSSSGTGYFAEMFTKTQVFHQHFKEADLEQFLAENVGITFKNCVKRTDSEEITLLTNKKGEVKEVSRIAYRGTDAGARGKGQACNKVIFEKGNGIAGSNGECLIPGVKLVPSNVAGGSGKNYILREGVAVPFLVLLGVMTPDGKVIKAKYDKFRQINRFLEFINDILPEVLQLKKKAGEDDQAPVRVADFGCGKSYLTFAVHYFLTEVKKIPCQIEGLDLKEDVIKYCNDMAGKLGLEGLIFHTGNISDYSGKDAPDIVITLHACDTATDFALEYAVEKGAKAILSVPCCQHQINQQLQKNKAAKTDSKNNGTDSSAAISEEFLPLLKWGIIREKFSSLVTDAIRGQWLESKGYKVQMLEFIDMEHTPKNILIRAVRNGRVSESQTPELLKKLGVAPELYK